MLFLFPTPGKSLEIGRILLFSLLVPFYSPLPYNIEPLIPPPPYLFWVINLTGRRRFVHLLSARVGRENLHQGSRKSRSLHWLQFIGLSAVSLLFLLSRIFYRPDIILPDCLPFPFLSKKTGAKADRFLLFSKCNRKVWQPCCRLPARAVLRRTPPPRDVRGCRLGQTTWGTLNPGWVPLYKMIESICSSVYHVYGDESPSSFICDVIMLLAHSNIMRGIERWVKRWTFEIFLQALSF